MSDKQAILIAASILIAPHMSRRMATFMWFWAFATIAFYDVVAAWVTAWWAA